MPKYVVEREFPGIGMLSEIELRSISQTSCNVLKEMGSGIQWLHSFVSDNKIYCVFIAPDEEAVRTHSEKGGFPVSKISKIHTVIDPTTAENATT